MAHSRGGPAEDCKGNWGSWKSGKGKASASFSGRGPLHKRNTSFVLQTTTASGRRLDCVSRWPGEFDGDCDCQWCQCELQRRRHELDVMCAIRRSDAPAEAERLQRDAPPRQEWLQAEAREGRDAPHGAEMLQRRDAPPMRERLREFSEEDAPVGAEWLHEGDAPLNKRRLQKEGRSSKFCDAPAVGERLQERDAPPSKSRLTREVQEEEVEENMLKRGISVVVGGKRKEASKEKKQGTEYISEEYAVRKGKVRDIIFRLGCGEPSVDGFATVENHLFPVWLGPGGYVENSLAAHWGDVKLQ